MRTRLYNTLGQPLKAAFGLLLLGLLLSRPAIAAGPPPVIGSQPQDAAVVLGNTATFTVGASSGTTLSYQWYKAGLLGLDSLLSGETRTNLVITGVGLLDPGQFYVKVSNASGSVQSRSASLSLALLGNSVPVVANDAYSTLEDNLLSVPAPGVLANDTDANSDPITATLVTNVTQGTLSLNADGSFVYAPPTNFFGNVSFSYRASDGIHVVMEQSNSGGDDRQINEGSTAAQSFRHGSAGGTSYFISKVVLYLSRRSGGSGDLNFCIGNGVNSGTIPGSAKAIPTSSISNTSDGSTFQTYTVLFAAPIGPFTAGTTYYLNFHNEASERFYVEYPNSNAYANGSYFEDGVNQSKDMRFQIFEVLPSNPATVTINVLPVNDAPIAVNDTKTTLEDKVVLVKVLANDSDPEGTPLTLTDAWTSTGTVALSGTNVLYLPPTNFNGITTFNYSISDGSLSSTGTVTVTVTPVNDAPVAAPDFYTTPENSVLTVSGANQMAVVPARLGILANDTDVENDVFVALLVDDVSHGSLVLNSNGTFVYTPEPNFSGTDSFTYVACDGPDDSPVTLVTINVTAVPDPAQISSQKMTPGGFEFQIAGVDSATYVISATSNFRDWTPIFTNYTASGSMTFTDPDSATNRSRFYRVESR